MVPLEGWGSAWTLLPRGCVALGPVEHTCPGPRRLCAQVLGALLCSLVPRGCGWSPGSEPPPWVSQCLLWWKGVVATVPWQLSERCVRMGVRGCCLHATWESQRRLVVYGSSCGLWFAHLW